ncbi:MAG: SLC13 family permease [Actinomycetes bacterium]
MFDQWLTAGVVLATVVALATEVVPPFVGMLAAVTVLYVAGVVDFAQAFGGYASSAVIAISAFYVIAYAINKTDALRPLLTRIMPQHGGIRGGLVRLTIPSAVLSAFANNTPIVAMLIEPVRAWGRRTGHPASRLLIPVSYATILGGGLTLIGTSTNLIVSDLLVSAGQQPLGFFESAQIALPVAIVGLAVVVVVGPRVLPDRSADTGEDSGTRRYTVTMQVDAEGPLTGVPVSAARLDHVHVTRVERGSERLEMSSDPMLQGGDRVTIRAAASDIVDLDQTRGLDSVLPGLDTPIDLRRARVYEGVVGRGSWLSGKNPAEVQLLDRYGAGLLAVHKGDETAQRPVDRVELHRGDTLLMVAERGFRQNLHVSDDFVLVSPVREILTPVSRLAPLAVVVLVGVVLLAALGLLPIAVAAVLGVLVLVLSKVVSPDEALKAIDLSVVLLIGAAFGVGAAVTASGLDETIADWLSGSLGGVHEVVFVAVILAATLVLTELISNSAAAILAVPIAVSVASVADGIDARLLAIAVGVTAGFSFLTPVGYQTNTMVYGPGNYRFTDFGRLGLPMAATALVIGTAAVLVLS